MWWDFLYFIGENRIWKWFSKNMMKKYKVCRFEKMLVEVYELFVVYLSFSKIMMVG